MNQFDVEHRTFERKMALVIVLFHGKNDRNNFYYQKKLHVNLHLCSIYFQTTCQSNNLGQLIST